MLPAILAILFLWSPVVETCRGEATQGVTYRVSYVYAACTNLSGDWEAVGCSRFVAQVDTGYETRWETEIGQDDPPVGAGYWYEVTAVNALGHRSSEDC